jgi:DNA mismatch endonuclease, patch repair protein
LAERLDQSDRSKLMARIGGKDTAPELVVRRGLHAAGFRFRLHMRNLPGRPDLVLPKYRAVIFVNGCFWHGHDCDAFRWPATRQDFWTAKISGNRSRDAANTLKLTELDWRVGIVWECALRRKATSEQTKTLTALKDWLRGTDSMIELRGDKDGA